MVANFEYAKNAAEPHVRFSEEFLIWAAKEASGIDRESAMFYKAIHGLNDLVSAPRN